MYTFKPLLLTCLLSPALSRADLFTDMMQSMNEHMQQMEAHMKHMEDMMQASNKFPVVAPAIAYTISEDKDAATIEFKGIQSDKELNAVAGENGDNLTIQTPQGTINIRAHNRILTVEVSHKEEQKKEDKGHTGATVSMSSSSSSRLCKQRLLLNNVDVEYNQKNQILTIVIPKEEGKAIPIAIKKK